MASELKSVTQIDFSGGLNVVTNPYLLGKRQVYRCSNMILDEHGSLRTRDGTLLESASLNSTTRIVKVYDFVRTDLTTSQHAIRYQSSTGNLNQFFERSSTPWTAIGTFNSAYLIPDCVTFLDKVLIAAGNTETPNSYDGTTFQDITGSIPGCAHIAIHRGYVWGWNTSNSTSGINGPSSLRSSDLNNEASWPAASQVFISRDDAQQGQGLGLFTIAETGISPDSALIAFKDYSSYEVISVFGASNFAVQRTKSDMGCVAPRTIQFVSGFGIIRLTHKGFGLFDGVNDVLISEEVRPYIFGRDDIGGLSWTNIANSYAVQVQNPPLYICVCPVDSAALTRWFIYDLVRKAWTIGSFANSIASLQLIANPGELPVVRGGDFSAGRVRRYFSGDLDDDGTAITWEFSSRPMYSKSPMSRHYFRRLIVKMFDVANLSVVTATFNMGPTAPLVSKTIRIPTTLAAFAGYGVDSYGTLGYGSEPGSQFETDIDVNFDIGRIANNCRVTLSGSGPARIRGLEWHMRDKALTRSTIAA